MLGSSEVQTRDGSVPFNLHEFSIDGVGGGLVIVNHYGDYLLSVACVDIGVLGETWADLEDALSDLRRTANVTSTKCTATSLGIGGAGILLYMEKDSAVNRKLLWTRLAKELSTFSKTQLICLPGSHLETGDLIQLEKANQMVQKMKEATKAELSSHDEKKSDASSSSDEEEDFPSLTKRSSSVTLLNETFEFPVPAALISDQAIQGNVIAKAKAYSSLGALSTLLKAKGWSRIILLGVTSVSCELYQLLSKETDFVYLSDPSFDYKSTRIPKKAFIPWPSVFQKSSDQTTPSWDVMVFCSREYCPILSAPIVEDTIQGSCYAVVSISDDFLPLDPEERELATVAFENCNIFNSCDGMCDLGGIDTVYNMAEKRADPSNVRSNALSFDRAYEMGTTVMKRKLHISELITDDSVVEKTQVYDLIMENKDESTNRHLGLGTVMHHSSERMTDWMWARAQTLCPAFRALRSKSSSQTAPVNVRYLDLGAGSGVSARWICKQHRKLHVTCVDVNPSQCDLNRNLSDEAGFGSQIDVKLGSFDRLSVDYSNWFDGCFSQDSFHQAFDKLHTFSEAFRVTKGGGWLMISDLLCGDKLDGHADELQEFVDEHNIGENVSPKECVALAKEAGWAQVEFVDCSTEIKISLMGILKQIRSMIQEGKLPDSDLELLKAHRLRMSKLIGQADRGIFKWGIIAARKPYDVVYLSKPPVEPQPHAMMNYVIDDLDGQVKFGTDVLVVNIKEKLSRAKIMALPSTTRLIVTLSAGLDHIDTDAAKERGIRIRRAARSQIVKSVADYLLSNIIFGLRNGFQNVGVPFPGASWDLQWNSDGVDLDDSKIGFIGMGAIAVETARRVRALSPTCELVYHVPKQIRSHFEEGTYRMHHIGIADLISTCDVIVPMVPLTEHTTGLIDYSSFAMMKNTAIFINMARGKVVDTVGMLKALKEKQVLHAILDTTDPEPLPVDHELWNLNNCTITPHFATNTTYVRKELVEDVPNQVEDTLDERGILRLEEERMRVELSEAYRITREFGMDELVWNHISVILMDGTFLITPGSRMFDDIGPQDLVKSSGNITADIIHDAIYKKRPDVKAIVHLHTPATVAVSCLEMGFVPLAQEAAPFIGRVARHSWHGVSNDREEQAFIGEAIKDKNVNTLLMENHGFCTFAKSLGEAWVLAYYFDKACQTQLSCLQTGQSINYPSKKVLAHAAQQAMLPEFEPGACEWDALRKMLTRRHRR